jgi:hypothetical protein
LSPLRRDRLGLRLAQQLGRLKIVALEKRNKRDPDVPTASSAAPKNTVHET